MNEKRKKLLRRGLIILLAFIVSIPTLQLPVATVIIYEAIFHTRYETAPWLGFQLSDFPGLSCSEVTFSADGEELRGYLYSSGTSPADAGGIVIISHGHGGGGQNSYMPFADVFAKAGYLVLAYDAPGNDQSPGFVGGLPRGVLALSGAIDYVSSRDDLCHLPIMLFGHSWGAYSGANVLNLHPEIAGAAFVSGFNESEDMIGFYAREYVGPLADLTMPYISFYERLKFGREVTSVSGVSGMAATDAAILIAHSSDDGTVPTYCGFETYAREFRDDPRFTFVEFSDQGHTRLLYSPEADTLTSEFNSGYTAFVEANGGEYSEEMRYAFIEEFGGIEPCFEPDGELMALILQTYAAGAAAAE